MLLKHKKTFVFWVLFFGVVAFINPSLFSAVSPYVPMILGVIIMFGMGVTMTVDDFKGVLKQPCSIDWVIVAQYTVMPLIAYALCIVFALPTEIAIGVILVGCCPGGIPRRT